MRGLQRNKDEIRNGGEKITDSPPFFRSVSEYEEKENQTGNTGCLLHYVYTWADLYDRKQLYATLRNAAGI